MTMGQPNKTFLTRNKIHRAFGPFLVPYLKDDNVVEISRNESDGWIWVLNKAGLWHKEFAIEDSYAADLTHNLKKLINYSPPQAANPVSSTKELLNIIVDEYQILCPTQSRRPIFTIKKSNKITPKKKSINQRRVVPTVPFHHDWLKNIRRVSLVYEYLLDKYFGVEISDDPIEQEGINQKNIKKAEEIISLMLERRLSEKIKIKKLLRSKTLNKQI